MKHLLKLLDCSKDDIVSILDLADQLKYEKQHHIAHRILEGKSLGMIFQKPSTRTRVSFEAGMYQLGGQPMFLTNRDLQIGRGEPMQDTARALSRYLDGIVIRTYDQKEVETLAGYGTIPVINGLTNFAHPCQVLADLMTIREHFAQLEGIKMGFVGDGFNMCNSLIVGCLKAGMEVSVATPEGYEPHPDVLAFAEQMKAEGAKFDISHDPRQAADGVDVLITDAWTGMGQEEEAEQRRHDFAGFTVDHDLLACCKEGVMVQHCMPAYRGEEISAEVLEEHADEIFEEAENRLHAQKAVLVTLMSEKYEIL